MSRLMDSRRGRSSSTIEINEFLGNTSSGAWSAYHHTGVPQQPSRLHVDSIGRAKNALAQEQSA